VFSFGLDADLVDANPCSRLKKRGVENVGRRVLSDSEIRLFWRGIVEPERSRRTGLGLRLALLLGCRVGELAGLARSELTHIDDPARATWTIPAARVKNGRDHLLPLPPLARDTILQLLSLIGRDEQFLFPTRSGRRSGPMRSNSFTQAQDFFSQRVDDDARAETWIADPPTPHDLRPSDVGDKHYNLHDYSAEKRDALTRWSATLSAILWGSADNVTQLRAAP
jgi:integrase